MTEKHYQQLLAEAKRVDTEFEKKYGNKMLIPRKLNEGYIERLRKLEREINELKRDLKQNGIDISNVYVLEPDYYCL